MEPMITRIIFMIFLAIIALALIAGIVILQIYLSKRESKWPGLILPMITFGLTVIRFAGILIFGIISTTTNVTYYDILTMERVEIERIEAERAEIYRRITGNEPPVPVVTANHQVAVTVSAPASVAVALSVFFINNISTVILLIIYAVCRDKRRNLQALNRMSLQDL